MAKVTLRDVAEAAGVSIATASWAVNDNRDVQITESTRRKVRRAADELGYHHNALARGLARGCSDIIGFISDGVATSPFAGQVIQGAQDEAWRNGKILLVVDTDGRKDVERRTFSFMFEHQVEGIIYSKWVHGSITPPDELGRMPSVLVNCYDERGRFPAVVPDEVQGGATATRLLLEAGHRRIAFVNDAAPLPASVGRLAGYKAALARFDVDFDPSLVLSVTADQEGGYGAAAQVLATGATGVFCHNDRTRARPVRRVAGIGETRAGRYFRGRFRQPGSDFGPHASRFDHCWPSSVRSRRDGRAYPVASLRSRQ